MITQTLTGRLGKPAEVRTAGTTQVVNFTVAVDIGYGDKKKTLWVECAKFGDNTKVAEYMQKGQQVLVIGEPDIRVWDSNGKHGASMVVRVDKIELIGGRQDQQPETSAHQSNYAGQRNASQITEPDDQLPF